MTDAGSAWWPTPDRDLTDEGPKPFGVRCAMQLDEAIAWLTDDVAEMAAQLRAAGPGQPVPACPGWSASDLSRHIAIGFFAWYPYNISTPAADWSTEGLLARFAQIDDDHLGNIARFESGAAQFVGFCAELDLDTPTWSFGGVAPAGWWIRRSGTELTVHLTDAAGIHGRRSATTPDRHAEAIDEVTTEIFPRVAAVKATMSALTGADPTPPAPPDQPVTLITTDTNRAWTLDRDDDGSPRTTRACDDRAVAVGRGSSTDVLAWLHGRPMTAPLAVEGDPGVLDEWNLFQRGGF